MFPGGRYNYPYGFYTSLQNPFNGGGYYPDRMYSHSPGALNGDSRYKRVFGLDSGGWSYTDIGRYGRYEPYDRSASRRFRRYRSE